MAALCRDAATARNPAGLLSLFFLPMLFPLEAATEKNAAAGTG